MVFKYSIHGLVDIISDIPCAPPYFQTSRISGADLIVKKTEDIDIDKSKLSKIGLSFYGKQNLLYFEYQPFPRLTIKVLIKGLFQEKTEVLFNKYALVAQRLGRLAKGFSVRSIVEFIKDLKLLEKGVTPIHSAGVEKDGNAYLISAWSETGKTSTMLALSKKGFNLLGDDEVHISKYGEALCYPAQIGLFFHTENLQSIELSFMKRIKLKTKYFLSKIRLLETFAATTERIELSKVGKVERSGKVRKVFLLEGGKTELMKISREEAIDRILATSSIALRFNPITWMFFSALCYLNAVDPYAIKWKSREIIEKGLRRADCFLLKGTKEEFSEMILDEIVN